jgi:endonuclease/exonuclease/phosphatase family metal-dependent hydrolase
MKKFVFTTIILLAAGTFLHSQEIKIMTYNLRYENIIDGENNWPDRRDFLLSQINYYEPEIFGTQEGIANQLKYLDDNLENYKYIGIGRDEDTGNGTGEFAAIFYNIKKFKILESGTFWLSENPSKPGKGWDAAQNRICTYGLFQGIKDGKKFWLFNTHFDHRGDIARAESAKLILKQIKSINKKNYPFVLSGDLNLTPDQEPVKLLAKELNDSRSICVTKPFGPEETFTNFQVCVKPEKRIDYIFTSKENITVKKYAVLTDVQNVRYASDHYPVLINIVLSK